MAISHAQVFTVINNSCDHVTLDYGTVIAGTCTTAGSGGGVSVISGGTFSTALPSGIGIGVVSLSSSASGIRAGVRVDAPNCGNGYAYTPPFSCSTQYHVKLYQSGANYILQIYP